MADPSQFPQANFTYKPPVGREEDITPLPVFKNRVCNVSKWTLTDEEIEEIVRTKSIFVAVMSGDQFFPLYASSEESVRSMVIDYGPVWERSPV